MRINAMVVLFAKGVYEIPPHYVIKRWSKDAKSLDIVYENSTRVNEDNPSLKRNALVTYVWADQTCQEGCTSKDKCRRWWYHVRWGVCSASRVPDDPCKIRGLPVFWSLHKTIDGFFVRIFPSSPLLNIGDFMWNKLCNCFPKIVCPPLCGTSLGHQV
ncbi:hypothetical protein IFM89_010049 [Coptis chinensis]|uniref:Protein FAR1-RELATED SEQUENCE n=1 Tax=Coptis chinensis TaxID=261450 RepID=A0A835LLZ9_9MAGN|nr:hypothetical protein IFM89_010049 [Coptis chinensis]